MSYTDLFAQYHSIIFDGSDTINKALTMLAGRINPTSNRDNGWWEYMETDSFDKRCLICCQPIVGDSHMEAVGSHGMQHLKEHNLLPFM